jgi:hypothetical protein
MRYLSGQTFTHLTDTNLRSTKNGALLRAIAPDYDVFVTRDQNIPFQQNLKRFPLAFVILRARTNSLADLLPLVPALLALLDHIEAHGYAPGDLHEITQ